MKNRDRCYFWVLMLMIIKIVSVPIFLSSCTFLPAAQGRIRNLVVKGDFDYAATFVDHLETGVYGKNNELLELLDRGMVYHYAGHYQQSIDALEKAKKIYDDLYTKSLSKIAASWLWNDSSLPYAGEDFERVAINIIQALNFMALEQYEDALVEARNVDSVLTLINDRYNPGQKNIYAEDAFARLLMGIAYEWNGGRQDMNDAFISYRKAHDIYEKDFFSNYGLRAPLVLNENVLTTAQWMGQRQLSQWQHRFSDVSFVSLEEKQQMAEVYVLCYRGQIVNKLSSSIVLPGIDGLLTRVSFPKYRKSFQPKLELSVKVVSASGKSYDAGLSKVQDFNAIARQNLEDRRLRILSKAVARPLTKQFLVEAIEDKVADKAGETAGEIFNYAGNVYLLYSEQADIRGWDTLPSEVYVARLLLAPGDYHFFINDRDLGNFFLEAGNKKMIMHWIGY